VCEHWKRRRRGIVERAPESGHSAIHAVYRHRSIAHHSKVVNATQYFVARQARLQPGPRGVRHQREQWRHLRELPSGA
jgi:hypothetical protein